MDRTLLFINLLACCLLLGQQAAQGSEGGSSYYFPGSSSTFGVAVAPDPGFLAVSQLLIFSGTADKAVLRGHANLELKSNAVYNYFGGFYTFKAPVLGGQLQIGAAVPIGSVYVKTGLDSHIGSRNISDTNTNMGDTLASAALHWKKDDLHFKLVQSVFLPTGGYDSANLANVGRNYWGFDTAFAMTWLSSRTGTEVSLMPGFMFNTRNNATAYQTGNEFHLDFGINQFLAKSFAIGFQGYYYNQLSADSGSGAKLGSFMGRSVGVGPALIWKPGFGNGKLSLIAKWLHDLDDSHRMNGDYGQFVIGYKF